MRSFVVGVALLWGAVAGLAWAPAASADGWTPPLPLTSGNPGAQTGYPLVAVAPDGSAVATWVEGAKASAVRVVARAISPTGAVSGKLTVSAPGAEGDIFARPIDIAMGADGVATIVWVQSGTDRVMARRVRADGTFASGELVISDPAVTSAGQPAVAVGPDGVAGVSWLQATGGDIALEFRQISPTGGLGPIRELVETGAVSGPEVEAFANGTANVVAVVEDPLPELQSFRVSAAGVESVRLVAAGAALGQPDTASDAAGNVRVVWDDGTNVNAARIPPAGPVEAPVVVGDRAGSFPVVAVAPDGTATVVWRRVAGSSRAVARRIAADGTLGPRLTLASSSAAEIQPAVTTEPDGTATAMWAQSAPGLVGSQVLLRRIAPSGGFADDPQVLGTLEAMPPISLDVASGPAGSAVGVWFQDPLSVGLPPQVLASRYVTSAPSPPAPAPGPAPAPAPPAPPPPAEPPAVTLQPPAGSARATIASGTATVRAGRATFRVRCRARRMARCRGTLAIAGVARRGGRPAGANDARFSVRAGRVAAVRVRLSPQLRAAVRRRGRVTVRVVVRTRQADGRLTVTGRRAVVLRGRRVPAPPRFTG